MMKEKRENGKRGKSKRNSVQELLGIDGFSKYGLFTDHGELVFFQIAPTNISVLSYDSVQQKIANLQALISLHPNLEILCSDSCECFDGNREYLRRRTIEETNFKVRALLETDRQMLQKMQSEMSNARQFFLIMRLNGMTQEAAFTAMNKLHKEMAERGFETRRMTKSELKRFLAIYLEASMDGDKLPDADGAQYRKGGV